MLALTPSAAAGHTGLSEQVEPLPRLQRLLPEAVGHRPRPGPEAGAEETAHAGEVPAAAHLVRGVRPWHVREPQR